MDRRSLLTAGAGLAAGSALVAAQSPQALAQAPAAIRSRLQTIQQNGTLRCGTTGDFNPMSFRDPATPSSAATRSTARTSSPPTSA